MFRRAFGLASTLFALTFLATSAEAQLGGLAKKARQTASEAAGVPSTDQPARMAGPEVTQASVAQLLTGLKAEQAAAEQQAAAERRRQEQATAARAAQERQEHCYEDKKNSDPAWAEIQGLKAQGDTAVDKGEYNKATQIAQQLQAKLLDLHNRVQAACAQQAQAAQAAQPSAEQQAMQQASGSPESAGAQAAGMSAQDYAQFKELVYTYLQSPKKVGLAEKEQQAIEAKQAQLRERLKAVGLG
jgi:hypothetical protein